MVQTQSSNNEIQHVDNNQQMRTIKGDEPRHFAQVAC